MIITKDDFTHLGFRSFHLHLLEGPHYMAVLSDGTCLHSKGVRNHWPPTFYVSWPNYDVEKIHVVKSLASVLVDCIKHSDKYTTEELHAHVLLSTIHYPDSDAEIASGGEVLIGTTWEPPGICRYIRCAIIVIPYADAVTYNVQTNAASNLVAVDLGE